MKKLFLGYQTGALLLCTDITEFKLFFLMKLGDKSGYFISEKEPHFFRIPQNFGNRIVALFLSHDFIFVIISVIIGRSNIELGRKISLRVKKYNSFEPVFIQADYCLQKLGI